MFAKICFIKSKVPIFLTILLMKGKIGDKMQVLRKYHKIIFIILFISLLIIISIIKLNLVSKEYDDIKTDDIKITNNDDNSKDLVNCMIDIKGEVNNPGVYTTSCDDNVSDVIRLAGGLTEDADTSITNLAKKVNNEMVIIIYSKEEVKNSNVVDTVIKVVEQECVCPNIQNDGCINDKITDTIGKNKLININEASLEELKNIPGIGDAKAKAIIDYRNKKGKFQKVEDIQNVDGIGSKLYEEIKIYITT